jgi:hypothetical protein
MPNRAVTERHHPSVWAYLRQLFLTSIAFSEKAGGMMSLLFMTTSVLVGLVMSLTAPEINKHLDPWSFRVSTWILGSLIVQFLVIIPISMWRNAVWVQNVEKSIDALWDLHHEGVLLMNAHSQFMQDNPNWRQHPEKVDHWMEEWLDDVSKWKDRTDVAWRAFAPDKQNKKQVLFSEILSSVKWRRVLPPLKPRVRNWKQWTPILSEARRLKSVIIFPQILEGLNELHQFHMNILRERFVRD